MKARSFVEACRKELYFVGTLLGALFSFSIIMFYNEITRHLFIYRKETLPLRGAGGSQSTPRFLTLQCPQGYRVSKLIAR